MITMALNRFLASETGSTKVEIVNPVLEIESVGGVVSSNLETGAGVVTGDTQRLVFASDDPLFASVDGRLDALDNVISPGTDHFCFRLNMYGALTDTDAGVATDQTLRVTMATDDTNLAAINANTTDPTGLTHHHGDGAERGVR
jgi:hypothetical protein